ncbi:uncharacterized protein LOC132559754 [Ylistrum balloti]|uniref:uncharacterized protein LOC132559754 n=1 Tax=Ylistrum balloti TaxID=509963 RepID=UPI002905AAF5|nr:uncharacterized protein LOC132559754 [Ylistrum balloti]
MINFRKLPFWEKFSFGRSDLNAHFLPNHSTHVQSYNYDNDPDYNVVITPAPDYDESPKHSRSFKSFWTMKGRSKNAPKRIHYFYDSGDNENSQKRKKDHHCSHKQHRKHSPEREESPSDDSDSSFSSTSTHSTMHYRKVSKDKRHRRRNRSSSEEKQERKSRARSSKNHEHDFESSPYFKRKHRRGSPLQRNQDGISCRRKEKDKRTSDSDHKRGIRENGRDSYASDSSSDRIQAKTMRQRKQTKSKKSRKIIVSDTDENWTIREKTKKRSDGVMLKITMNDLRNVITENVLSAVKQGIDDDMTKQPMKCVSPEILTTDTETLNSGFSAGSCNSTDALLPVISGRRMSSAFQPVPQRQSGMLKRFIPVPSSASSDNTGSRNSSVATVKSFLSGSTTDAVDMAVGTAGNGGGFGASMAHYDRLEDKLMIQTNSLRGRHIRESEGLIYEENIPQATIHQNLSATQGNQSYFQDGNSSGGMLSPRNSMDFHSEPVMGPFVLPDSNGRRMSTTYNNSQMSSMTSDSDVQNTRQRRGSMNPNFGSTLPNTCTDHTHLRRQSMCLNMPSLHTNDTVVPNQAYLSRRRQSLPVNLTTYPYTDLASIGMEAILAASEAKKHSSTKEKLPAEKCLSTVLEESADSVDDKSAKEVTLKTNIKPSAELLKDIKETAKEKRKTKVTKALAFLSSILLVLAGIGVVVVGVLNMMDGEAEIFVAVTKKSPKDESFKYYCYGLCFIGTSVVLVCVCGLVGTLKVKTCLLKMVILGFVLLLILQVVMVTMVVISQKDMPSIPLLAAVMDGVKDVVLDHMKTSLHDSYKVDTSVARAWDQLQIQMECCGCQNQDDYKYSAWWNTTANSKTKMPDSCCIVAVKDIDNIKPTNQFLCQSMTPGFWHDAGCHDILMIWYKQNSVMAFGATTGLAALEMVSLLCTVRLYLRLIQMTSNATAGSV